MDCQALLARSEDWLKYAVRFTLCGEPKDELLACKDAALADVRIGSCLQNIRNFHGTVITNHKNPYLPIHQLLFLLDLGFDTGVPEIAKAVDEILSHRDESGVYQSVSNIPKHFGGSGEDAFGWSLCDAPLLLLALFKADVEFETFIRPGLEYLLSLSRENGFPCAVSPELGRFRGPGRADDCCPYATLIMADLLSGLPEYRDSSAAVSAVNTLLNLWENSRSKHPYVFYMGTDFRKLKAPSHWYDIVSVANVLSKFQFIRSDPRFLEMIAIIKSKQDAEGFFTPESVYQKYKDWDFGQKKQPSPYLTFQCLRILQRLETSA